MNKLYIIGIGFKPLEEKTKNILLKCPFIVLSPRLHEVFKKYEIYEAVKEKIIEIKKVEETFNFIKRELPKHSIVLIASGDPLYFGIGIKAIEIFGEENIEIYPDLSCLQKGLSLIKKNWHGIPTLSFHGRRFDMNNFFDVLSKNGRVAILTDTKNSPDMLAREIMKKAKSGLTFHVFERLGYEDEKVTIASLDEVAKQTFKEPNFVIVSLSDNSKNFSDSIIFGLEEEEIEHIKGMITKDEIRACVIHKLRPPKKGVIWDIGAGSGAVSIELSLLSKDLEVYAIEKDSTDLIESNRERFGIKNLKIIRGEAPYCLHELPLPQRVFIGGSGGKLDEILNFVLEKKSLEIIVITAVSMETLNKAIEVFESKNLLVDVSQLNISRIEKRHGRSLFKALNPIFVIRGRR